MPDKTPPTAEEAQQVILAAPDESAELTAAKNRILAARKQRAEDFLREVQAAIEPISKKYRCDLQPGMTITASGVEPFWKAIPLD